MRMEYGDEVDECELCGEFSDDMWLFNPPNDPDAWAAVCCSCADELDPLWD